MLVDADSATRPVAAVLPFEIVPAEDGGEPGYLVRGDVAPYAQAFVDLGGRWRPQDKAWHFRGGDFVLRLVGTLNGVGPTVADGLAEEARPAFYAEPRFDLEAVSARLLNQGASTLSDRDLLQLLLYSNAPAEEARRLAGELMDRFGSLGAVLAAETTRLCECSKLDMFGLVLLKASQTLMERVLREKVRERTVLGSITELRTYLNVRLQHETIERLMVLFLDAKNGLIAEEDAQRGTVNHTPLYPREVVKRALEVGAAAVILVHNHPSGDPTPSRLDIDITRRVREALKTVDVALHEHLIVGRGRSIGLIGDGYV